MKQDFESSIINNLVNNKQSRPRIFARITQEDFFNPSARSAFNYLESLWTNKIHFDSEEIQNKCWNDFSDLITGGGVHWTEAISGLINSSVRKKCLLHLEELMQTIKNGKSSLSEIQDGINRLIEHTVDYRINLTNTSIEEIYKSTMELLNSEQKNISWGLTELDSKAPLESKTINVVGARPRVGKTALMISCAIGQLEKNMGVGIWCAEMTKEDIFLRLISQLSSIAFFDLKFKFNKLTPEQSYSFDKASTWLKDKNIHIKCGNVKAAEIKAWATEITKTNGVEIVWCDYIQKVEPRLPDKVGRRQQVRDIGLQLWAIAHELNIPLIVLAQLGRRAENVFPEIDHLGECSAIEDDAHIVLLLDRPRINKPNIDPRKYYTEAIEQNKVVRIDLDHLMEEDLTAAIIAKNRNGTTGMRFLKFHGKEMRFSNPEFDFRRKGEPMKKIETEFETGDLPF